MNDRTEREWYEREQRREVEISRNHASASRALLLGIFVTTIAALGVVFYVLSQQNQNQAPTVQPPDIKIDIPQPQVPQVQPPEVNVQPPEVNVQPPEVNITVPQPEVPKPDSGDTQQAPSQTEPPQQ